MSGIDQVERTIAADKAAIEMRDVALKLTTNRDYKKVITQGYFTDEAVRLVGLSADPNLTDAGREDVIRSIQAISYLQQYLRTLILTGNLAERDLEEQEDLLLEMQDQEDAE